MDNNPIPAHKKQTDYQAMIEAVSLCTQAQVHCYMPEQAHAFYGANTIAVERELAGAFVVKPVLGSEGEQTEVSNIRHIIRLANHYKIPLYTISTGQNWGYGSSAPAAATLRCFILDLSLLKRIELNVELGIARLQPGVTQQDLRDYLDSTNVELMVPVTGAGPTCSIVGNALERGYGITPHADHFGAVTSLTAVLSDGSLYQSAIASLDTTAQGVVDTTYKWGLGPYLDGLFTQSNLGVVTSLSLKLAHLPAVVESFYLFCAKETDLELVLPIVRQVLKEFSGIVGSINIMDSRRMLSMMVPSADELSLCVETTLERLKQQYRVSQWTCMGSLYGNPKVVKAVKKEIKRQLKGKACIERSLFISAKAVLLASKLLAYLPANVLTNPRRQLATLQKSTQIMRGVPNEVALPLAYWRNRTQPASEGLNPAKDNCGLLWYAPLVPITQEKVREFVSMVRSICLKHNIEPLITMTALQHDCIDSTVPLLFDRSDNAAVKAAKACLDELFTTGCQLGFVPYRLNIEQQNTRLDPQSPHWSLVSKIKHVMDPHNILAPGRYNP